MHLQLQSLKAETHCVARTRGALQPAAPRTMRSRAAGAFDSTFANKINCPIIIIVIIIIIFVVASVSLSLGLSLSTGAKTFDTNQEK